MPGGGPDGGLPVTMMPLARSAVRSASIRPYHGLDCPGDDSGIEHGPLVAQVEEFVLELLEGVLHACSVVELDLGPTCDPGEHQMADVVEGDLLGQLGHVARLLGSRTDQRELAAQDVEGLGELIDMEAAHERAHRPKSRIGHLCPLALRVADRHGTELEHGERVAALAHPDLSEEERPWIPKLIRRP